ncbi:MAG: hypothetical protein ACE5G3_02170 [Gammaproteobacteria bacterium]
MAIAIRIGVLSLAAAVYMAWAFRGIEYEVMETLPALLELFLAFMVPTLVAVPVYRKTGTRDDAQVARFAFIFWLGAAAVVAAGWLILFGVDAAAAGYFRDNIILGVIGLIALVAVANFAVVRGLDYFAPKRR